MKKKYVYMLIVGIFVLAATGILIVAHRGANSMSGKTLSYVIQKQIEAHLSEPCYDQKIDILEQLPQITPDNSRYTRDVLGVGLSIPQDAAVNGADHEEIPSDNPFPPPVSDPLTGVGQMTRHAYIKTKDFHFSMEIYPGKMNLRIQMSPTGVSWGGFIKDASKGIGISEQEIKNRIIVKSNEQSDELLLISVLNADKNVLEKQQDMNAALDEAMLIYLRAQSYRPMRPCYRWQNGNCKIYAVGRPGDSSGYSVFAFDAAGRLVWEGMITFNQPTSRVEGIKTLYAFFVTQGGH